MHEFGSYAANELVLASVLQVASSRRRLARVRCSVGLLMVLVAVQH